MQICTRLRWRNLTVESDLLTDFRLFDFYRKRVLGPDQSHYNQSRLWSRLHITLAEITRITPSEYTPTTLYWKIFHRSGFLSDLLLPWKTEFALKIFTVLSIFFTIQDLWATLRLPWETEFALNSLYWTAFPHLFFCTTLLLLSLPLK